MVYGIKCSDVCLILSSLFCSGKAGPEEQLKGVDVGIRRLRQSRRVRAPGSDPEPQVVFFSAAPDFKMHDFQFKACDTSFRRDHFQPGALSYMF